jgi:lipopolysaccharide transport system permease protein
MSKILIEASKRNWRLDWRELVAYRDLFFVLAYRDFRVRYAQTFLGVAWALLQPLFTLAIFIVIFGNAIRVDTGEIPYPLFAVCGMAAWTYFAFVINNSGNSVVNSQEMIKKIYFPRLIIPVSKSVVGLIDLIISFLIVTVMFVYYQFPLSTNAFFLPFAILMMLIASLGVGIWFSALTIRYRDIQHVIPFLIQLGLYATPVGYPAKLVVSGLSGFLSVIYYINPMAGIIELFRWSMLGTEMHPYTYISCIVAAVLFISGVFYFKRVEQVMADIV